MGKLIRDRVPDIVRELGHHIEVRELAADEYAAALREKLVEEAREAQRAADRTELLEELADLAEVALALAQHEGITDAEILDQRAAKNRSHGTFDGRLFSTSYRS
ncbi:hypothetical protein ASF79_04460 [Agreia sp. Leaf335]|uniref:nucleoside triphosphate pyrophosphohydrolase n=1 Tax=Agreia sp. Leaf335 TaxID=1736340 RepID=UPI0006FB7824|nr:nucleoside triphosphate pyrophosphohydrolase [Agreia sp. Leaf335]KQR24445.1 hypothetical protein ASF79_04460 [Agreia sp. Leaf335]